MTRMKAQLQVKSTQNDSRTKAEIQDHREMPFERWFLQNGCEFILQKSWFHRAVSLRLEKLSAAQFLADYQFH